MPHNLRAFVCGVNVSLTVNKSLSKSFGFLKFVQHMVIKELNDMRTIFSALHYYCPPKTRNNPSTVQQLMYRGKCEKHKCLANTAAMDIKGFRTFTLQGEFI
jgi:hypothetical protein